MDIASLYPQAQPPTNPLTTMTGAMGLIGQMNQNKLFQQEFGAKKAIGQAYQGAVNPLTGELDTNKLLSTVANDPRAAFLAGDVAQQALARRQAQLGVDTSAQELAVRRQAATNMVLGPILANVDSKGNFTGTKSDALSAISEAHRTGMIDDAQTGGWINDISKLPDDPNTLKSYLQQHVVQALTPEGRAAVVMPTPQLVQTGAQQVPVTISPVSGMQPAAGTPIQNTLSATDLAAPQSWTDASGVQHQGTHAQFLQSVGGGGITPGAAGPAAAPAAAPVMPGRYPSVPAAGPIAGPAPGVVQSQEATAQASAAQGLALQHTADDVPARKGILSNMLGALNQFTPGPASESTRTMQAAAGRLGLNWDPNATSAQEEFSKFAKQLAIQQTGALGVGTNDKLEASTGASPNVDLSKLGNEKIIHILQGNEDAIAAKNRAWQSYQQQNGPQSYGKFSTEFNKTFDPRIWQMQYMPRDEQMKIIKGMSAADKQHFIAAKQAAMQLGLGQ